MELIVILFSFGLATAIIGRAKGSSFFIWFLVGFFLPFLGLVAVVLYERWCYHARGSFLISPQQQDTGDAGGEDDAGFN